MTLQPVNLWLRPVGGPPDGSRDKPVGKLVPIAARWAFHTDGRAAWKRRDSNSWGLSTAIIAWLKAHEVRDVYLRDRGSRVVFHTTIEELERAGLQQPGLPGFGSTLNLPVDRWETVRSFQAPYVPDAAKRVILVEDAAGRAA